MQYISFGTQNAQVSQIILGLMRINDMAPEKVLDLIKAALDAGINLLDIADCYGGGRCEEILGEALALEKGLREKFFIQTKCGIRVEEFTWFDFSKEHILEAVDGSLKRMKTDHVESLLLHRPDALMEPEEIAEAFDILHRSGKVLDFGVSNMNIPMMERLQSYVHYPIAANQIQLSCAFTPMLDAGFNVNMLHDKAVMRDGGIMEYCASEDIIMQAWSSLQYGYFEGVFLGSDKYPELNRVLEQMAEEKNTNPTAVALAWILRYPAPMQAVIGTTKAGRVRDAAEAADITLTKKEWYEIYLSAGNKLP